MAASTILPCRTSPAGTCWPPSAAAPAQRYILGNRNLTLAQFLDLVEQTAGAPVARPPSPSRLSALLHPRPAAGYKPAALVCDCRKAITELGLPQTPLELAFAEAVAWFRDNGYSR